MKLAARLQPLLLVLPLAVVLVAPAPARAQAFAVGAAGLVVNDSGSAEDLSSFGTFGGHAFLELALEKNVLFQLRYSRFELPAHYENSPNLTADAGDALVAYLFKDEWWRGGFIGGFGYYHTRPKSPKEGQVVQEQDETKFGIAAGVLTVFDLNRAWDIRLEGMVHFIRNSTSMTPITISAGVTYHF